MNEEQRYEVRLGDRAERDLENVAQWYVERHPSGEQRFCDQFAEARDMLARFPFAGRERLDLRGGLRSWVIHPYRLFYVVDDHRCIVTIERVLHGSMDLEQDDLDV